MSATPPKVSPKPALAKAESDTSKSTPPSAVPTAAFHYNADTEQFVIIDARSLTEHSSDDIHFVDHNDVGCDDDDDLQLHEEEVRAHTLILNHSLSFRCLPTTNTLTI
jgi:hypothetical protein